jgi:hypothetical protein
MEDKHESYGKALEAYTENKIDFIFQDIHEELDNIERVVDENEYGKLLLNWVRDAIIRVSENYER